MCYSPLRFIFYICNIARQFYKCLRFGFKFYMSTKLFSSTLHIVVNLFVLTTNEVVGIDRGGKKYEKSHSHILLTVSLRTVPDLLTRLGAVEGPCPPSPRSASKTCPPKHCQHSRAKIYRKFDVQPFP